MRSMQGENKLPKLFLMQIIDQSFGLPGTKTPNGYKLAQLIEEDGNSILKGDYFIDIY
jgi:hypothetical protein